MINKYIFNTYQVDINNEIQQYLYNTSKDKIEYFIDKNFDMIDHDVLSDDLQCIFTYKIENKAFPFTDVVQKQLQQNIPKMQGIENILQNNSELWAYCVGFNDFSKNDWIYTFRKLGPGKIAFDQKKCKSLLKVILTYFNTTNQKLELLEGDTVKLDETFDFIYYDKIFYITNKWYFEQIVGLEEEYKEEAKNVIEELKKINKIDGLDRIESQIETTPAIHKKLVRIARIGNYRDIDNETIKKMETVCQKHGDDLKIKNGKLLIEDEKDIDIILKMLADYYKTGDVSGKAYGTYSGKELSKKE